MTITRPPACPSCASKKTWHGRLSLSGTEDGWVTRFYPKGLRFFSLARSVALTKRDMFSACMECGHIWGQIDPVDLRALLEKSANDEARALLADKA